MEHSVESCAGLAPSYVPLIGSAVPPIPVIKLSQADRRSGRVEDGRGSLGHAATLRFPSPLIEPDVRISRIRLSDWLHREAHETNH